MGSFFTFIVFAIVIYRIVSKSNAKGKKDRPKSAQQASANQRAYQTQRKQTATPDILQRAKSNLTKYQASDTTKEQLEREHRHVEEVKTTGAKEYAQVQKEAHPHDAKHVAEELAKQEGSLLGTVEDLMIKGVDTSLSFERDFVGEGMDMISSFQFPKMNV